MSNEGQIISEIRGLVILVIATFALTFLSTTCDTVRTNKNINQLNKNIDLMHKITRRHVDISLLKLELKRLGVEVEDEPTTR